MHHYLESQKQKLWVQYTCLGQSEANVTVLCYNMLGRALALYSFDIFCIILYMMLAFMQKGYVLTGRSILTRYLDN